MLPSWMKDPVVYQQSNAIEHDIADTTYTVVPTALTVNAALTSHEIHYCCFYDVSIHSSYPMYTGCPGDAHLSSFTCFCFLPTSFQR